MLTIKHWILCENNWKYGLKIGLNRLNQQILVDYHPQ
jgi:hypothetical protein